jgi:hypothetical protein
VRESSALASLLDRLGAYAQKALKLFPALRKGACRTQRKTPRQSDIDGARPSRGASRATLFVHRA